MPLLIDTLCYQSLHKWLIKKPSFAKARNISNTRKFIVLYQLSGQKKKGYRDGEPQDIYRAFCGALCWFGKKCGLCFGFFLWWSLCCHIWINMPWYTWKFLLHAVLTQSLWEPAQEPRHFCIPVCLLDSCFITVSSWRPFGLDYAVRTCSVYASWLVVRRQHELCLQQTFSRAALLLRLAESTPRENIQEGLSSCGPLPICPDLLWMETGEGS